MRNVRSFISIFKRVVISFGWLQTYISSYFSVLNIGMEIGSWERSNRSIDIDADVDASESAG